MDQKELRVELQQLIDSGHTTQADIARGTNYSPAVVSQFLSGKYKGNDDNVLKSFHSFLQKFREKQVEKRYIFPFVETSVAKKITTVCRLCHIRGHLGVVVSSSSVGKTRSVTEYAKKHPDVILIEATPSTNAKILFSKLHQKLKYSGEGMIQSMFEDIVKSLKDSGRLIIIDEAENLPHKAINMLRRIYDMAHVGILFVGMTRLIENFRGKKGEFPYLYKRVGVFRQIEEIDENDAKLLIEKAFPNSNGLAKTFHRIGRSDVRRMEFLVEHTIDVAADNDCGITEKIVELAKERLLS